MTSVFPLGSCCCSSKASQSLSRTSWPCWLGFCWPTATSLPPSWAASSMRTWWKKVHGSWANVQFRLITIVKITTGVEWTFDFCHFQSTHLLLTWEKRGCIFTIITPLYPHPPFLHNVEFNSFFCYGRNIWSVVFFLFFFICLFFYALILRNPVWTYPVECVCLSVYYLGLDLILAGLSAAADSYFHPFVQVFQRASPWNSSNLGSLRKTSALSLQVCARLAWTTGSWWGQNLLLGFYKV